MYKIQLLLICFMLSVSLNGYVAAAEVQKKDKNKDGNPDLWIYFDDNNRPLKIESDRNYDGDLDMWINYDKKGRKIMEVDLNFDGKPDMHSEYSYGQKTLMEIDADYDGKLDQRNLYNNGKIIKMEKDSDSDGKLEVIFDRSNYQTKENIISIEKDLSPQR